MRFFLYIDTPVVMSLWAKLTQHDENVTVHYTVKLHSSLEGFRPVKPQFTLVYVRV